MENVALDPVIQAILSNVLPTMIVCGIAGIFLVEIRRWWERRFPGSSRGHPAGHKSVSGSVCPASSLPRCPSCRVQLAKQAAVSGAKTNVPFCGCRSYPKCFGTVVV